MLAKIGKRVVDAATTEDGWIWDTEVKGFGLRVRSADHKTYVVEYRPGTGGRTAPKRRFTIGRHGAIAPSGKPWTPDTARDEARRILGLVASGADPVADKTADRIAETVADLGARFLSDYVDMHCKPATAVEYRRHVEKIILPAIGAKKVKMVGRADVSRLHHSRRDKPADANRTVAVASKMFAMAEKWGICPEGSNPCRHVEKYPEQRVERLVTAEELGHLGAALAAYEGSPYVVAAVRLLVLTGARLSEVLGLQWAWIDLDRGMARLPDSKTGAKTIHLPTPALTVLRDLPRVVGNPHVIVGAIAGAALVNLEKPWRAIRERASVLFWSRAEEEVAKIVAALTERLKRVPTFEECVVEAKRRNVVLPPCLSDIRIHDLRHCFASVGAASGLGLPIIGKMLGHSQPQTTARYAHLSNDPVAAAAAAVAGKIADAMNGSGKTDA